MIRLILWAICCFSTGCLLGYIYVNIQEPILKKLYLFKANRDKSIPKPLDCILNGDKLYYFNLKDLLERLENLNRTNINENIFKKMFKKGLEIHKVVFVNEDTRENKIKIGSRNCASILNKSQRFSFHPNKDEKMFVFMNDNFAVSPSIKLLSIYIQKMIQECKDECIREITEKSRGYDTHDVYRWLESLDKKTLKKK